jgi:hypothetical protein
MTTSVYIPFVFPNITEDYIKARFESLEIGTIDRVDMVPKERMRSDGNIEYYFMAFVHFKHWSSLPAAQNIRARLEAGEQSSLNYDDPWYWVLWKNKCPETKEIDDTSAKMDCMMDMIENLQNKVISLEEDNDILAERIKHNRYRRFDLEDYVYDTIRLDISQIEQRVNDIAMDQTQTQQYDIEMGHAGYHRGLHPPKLVRQTNMPNYPIPPPPSPTCIPDLACSTEFKAEMVHVHREHDKHKSYCRVRHAASRGLCDN